MRSDVYLFERQDDTIVRNVLLFWLISSNSEKCNIFVLTYKWILYFRIFKSQRYHIYFK